MDHLALRTLYLTVSAFCLLMFVHFTTIITAEMTSGPADIPIKNFGDVLELGYDVIYQTKYIGDLLKTSDAESAKNKVYEKYIENVTTRDPYQSCEDLMSSSKTLMFASKANALSPSVNRAFGCVRNLFPLLMEDSPIIFHAGMKLQHS